MDDRHTIRVILQGIDRLSGVMREAASRSAPAFDSMRERMRRVQTESNKANVSLTATGNSVDALGDKVEKSRVKVERFTQSWTKLKNTMRDRVGRNQVVESPDDMFSRLRREGSPPRVRREQGGLPMFQSRADFVAQENQRRAVVAQNAALERQATLIGRVSTKQQELFSKFEGASPFDDLARGFRSFTHEALEGQDTLQAAQLKNQQALADFDKAINDKREEHIRQNQVDRADVERVVRIREENVRKGLGSIEKELDKFIIEENARLRNKTIQIGLDLGPSDEDRRIARSTTKKISDEERNAARKRVAEAKTNVVNTVALERTASEERIAVRRHETSEINRQALEGIRQGQRDELNATASASREKLKIYDAEQKQKRILLKQSQAAEIADLPELVRRRKEKETESIRTLKIGSGGDERDATNFEKLGARASRGISEFFRGISGARKGLAEFAGDARTAQTVAAQVGARFGDAAKSVNNLVSVRWALLLSLIGVLGTVITQLAGALVAVASSAVLAAAALGGALVTGVLTAIPVVGLLAAAFHSLTDAMKVVELRDQARTKSPDDLKARADAQRRAAEGLVDSQRGLKTAHEGVADAERALLQAHEAVGEANYSLAQSIRGVADAQRNLRSAHESVTDAEKAQRSAVKDLADARREARRGIIDASLEEKDARLSVREAELGVLDAKQRLADFEKRNQQSNASLQEAQDALKEAQDRLAAAKAQGDTVEIATSNAAVSAARGNVSAIQDQISQTGNQQKDLEANVKRAELSRQQARVREQRAIADNKRVQREGVEGSPGVRSAVERVTQSNRDYRDAVQGVKDAIIRVAEAEHGVTQSRRGVRDSIQGVADANRRLRDSHYEVAKAERSVKDAYLAVSDAAAKMNATQKNAQREFDKLSPGQQEFVRAMEEFQKTYKKYIAPITDTIVGAFARGIRGANVLMRDPEIRRNLQRLAGQIADIGDKFTKWVISPEGRRTINFFIREASRNLPKIAKAAGDLALAFINIGEAAAPIFDKIVSGLENISRKFKDATKQAQKFDPEDVFHHRESNERASALDKFFNTSGKHLTAWGRLTAAVGNFFKALVGAAAPEGLKMVQGMTRFFNRMADAIDRNPKKVGEFFKNVREGLQRLLPTLGKFALTLIDIFTSDEMIAFTQFMLLSVIPAILHVIQAIGLLIRFFGFLVGGIDGLLTIPLISTVGKWVIGLGLFFSILVKIFPVLRVFEPLLIGLAKAIFFVSRAMVAFLIANPWVALILAIIAIIIILDRHFHFLRPTIEAVRKAFAYVLEWVKDHWKLLAAILLGPFTLAIYEIHKHWDTIKRSFETAYGFIKDKMTDIGKAIYEGFLSPFKTLAQWFRGIGGWLNEHVINPIKKFFGISSPSSLMFDLGMDVVHGFVNAIKKLPGMVLGVLKSLPGMILGLFGGLGKKILDKITSFIPNSVKKKAGGIFGAIKDTVTGGAKVVESGAKSAGGAVVTGVKALNEQESWTNRYIIDQGLLNKNVPAKWRKNGFLSEMASVAADKKFRGESFVQYATNGKNLTVLLMDDDGRVITLSKNVGQKASGSIRQHFALGGEVGGAAGKAVPIVAHAGEWVLNKSQQYKLAARLGASVDNISNMLFGSKGKNDVRTKLTAKLSERSAFANGSELIPHEDDFGNTLWWVKLADGEYAQVSATAAKKIQSSNGTWFPGYINRAHGGAFKWAGKLRGMNVPQFSAGGVVSFAAPGISSFASGGIVGQGSVITGPSGNHVEVTNEFNVKTEGESDWNHIMRLGAQKAQEAYS